MSPPPETVTITKAQLQAALLQWEQDARNGLTITAEETLAKPVEQVASENADYLWEQFHSAGSQL